MRTLALPLAILALLAAPAASAGSASVDARYLDNRATCESERYTSFTNGTENDTLWWRYASSESSACGGEYVYAGASVSRDGQEVASARAADGWTRNSGDYQSGSSSYSRSVCGPSNCQASQDRFEGASNSGRAWSGVEASTAATGPVTLRTSECHDSWWRHESAWSSTRRSGDTEATTAGSSKHQGSASRCTRGADLDGPVEARRDVETCSWESSQGGATSSSWKRSNGTWNGTSKSWSSRTSDGHCFTGLHESANVNNTGTAADGTSVWVRAGRTTWWNSSCWSADGAPENCAASSGDELAVDRGAKVGGQPYSGRDAAATPWLLP